MADQVRRPRGLGTGEGGRRPALAGLGSCLAHTCRSRLLAWALRRGQATSHLVFDLSNSANLRTKCVLNTAAPPSQTPLAWCWWPPRVHAGGEALGDHTATPCRAGPG